MTDLIIFSCILSAIGLGLWGAFTNAGIYYRIASLVATLPICLGLAYFGWRPYSFRGIADEGTHFGCLMLTFGLLAWLFFRGASIAVKAKEK